MSVRTLDEIYKGERQTIDVLDDLCTEIEKLNEYKMNTSSRSHRKRIQATIEKYELERVWMHGMIRKGVVKLVDGIQAIGS